MPRQSFHRTEYYYQLLRVSRTASLQEIKQSYRKLALELHPDQHNGCSDKQAAFTELTHAYEQVLQDHKTRSFSSQRHSTARSVHYRKVYAPRPPPEWEFLWNHEKHRDMHYGRGFQKQALQQAIRQAKHDKFDQYSSPLGRGFSFSVLNDDNDLDESANVNPYSKHSPQGPPKIVMDFQQASSGSNGAWKVQHQERIVQDLYDQRTKRKQKEQAQQQTQQQAHVAPQYQRFQTDYAYDSSMAQTNPTFVGSARTGPPIQPTPDDEACVIL